MERLTSTERLTLAKLSLESVLTGEPEGEADWTAMSLSTFQRDWDNAEDAIYDNWRELWRSGAVTLYRSLPLTRISPPPRRGQP